jgi:hypothetical protein
VDLGTGTEHSWFAPEDIKIMPHQIWDQVIPDAVAHDFHRMACQRPGFNRSRIEREGLAEVPQITNGSPANVNNRTQLAPLVSNLSYRILD